MATRVKQEHWVMTVLLAILWPLKVTAVYFLDCLRDVVASVKREWSTRKRYTGWER